MFAECVSTENETDVNTSIIANGNDILLFTRTCAI